MRHFLMAALAGGFFAVLIQPLTALGQDPLLNVHVFPTDLADNPITSILVGGQYKLRTEVQDVRDPPAVFEGVFAAGSDVTYNSALSSIDLGQTVEFGSFFNLIQEASLADGHVVGYTATASLTPPGNSPQFSYSVVLTATAPGTQVFVPAFDTDPSHEYLLYGFIDVLTADQIGLFGSTLTIVPEPSSMALCVLAAGGLALICWRRRTR